MEQTAHDQQHSPDSYDPKFRIQISLSKQTLGIRLSL